MIRSATECPGWVKCSPTGFWMLWYLMSDLWHFCPGLHLVELPAREHQGSAGQITIPQNLQGRDVPPGLGCFFSFSFCSTRPGWSQQPLGSLSHSSSVVPFPLPFLPLLGDEYSWIQLNYCFFTILMLIIRFYCTLFSSWLFLTLLHTALSLATVGRAAYKNKNKVNAWFVVGTGLLQLC